MIASSFSKNSFLLVLAAPSSSLISASVICLSIYLLYHIFARLAIVRCCLNDIAKESHPLASFLIGLVLLGAGIFWVLNSFVVSFSWGSLWGGFGMNTSLATGLMLVPLLIGIGLLFFLDRKWIGWVVTAIGLLAILVTLLTSVRFRPVSASLWQYVVMFGMIAAGCGLVARGLLKSRD